MVASPKVSASRLQSRVWGLGFRGLGLALSEVSGFREMNEQLLEIGFRCMGVSPSGCLGCRGVKGCCGVRCCFAFEIWVLGYVPSEKSDSRLSGSPCFTTGQDRPVLFSSGFELK